MLVRTVSTQRRTKRARSADAPVYASRTAGPKLTLSSKQFTASDVQRFVRAAVKGAKKVESKIAIFRSNTTAFNQQINAAGDVLRILPTVSQGINNNQRIGTEIKVTKLNVRGVITMTFPQATANNARFGIRLTVLRAKAYNDWQLAATAFGTDYIKLLEGQTLGNQGTLLDFNTPINFDAFTVVKDMRLKMTQGIAPTATGSSSDAFSSTAMINFDVPCTKKLHYDEQSDVDDPNDFPYFMLINYTKLDGSAVDAAGTTYLTLQYVSTLRYDDA